MTDIEPILRAALDDRARTVTSETLLRPHLDSRRGRSARWLPAAATAAVVVTIAVVVALFAQSDRTARQPPAGGGNPGFVGYTWTVANVRGLGHVVNVTPTPVPTGIDPGFAQSRDASIAFDNAGNLYGWDSVNGFSGTYKLTNDGFGARKVASTAVGYAGTDQTIITLQLAFARILAGSDVGAAVDGQTLTLSSGPLNITFHRAGAAPSRTPTPSATVDVGSTDSAVYSGAASAPSGP